MSDSDKKDIEILPKAEPAPDNTMEASKIVRDMEMFKAWLAGASMSQIAEKFSVSVPTVSLVAKKYKWKTHLVRYQKRQYRLATNRLKTIMPKLQDVLEQDAIQISETAKRENRMLTPAERSYLLSLYDRILKEIRLDDGNPTDVPSPGSTGKVSVEIILPAGSKDIGIIPPNPVATLSEKKPETKDDTPAIDLDALEET
jgi:transposase